jgi:hypothetical protein
MGQCCDPVLVIERARISTRPIPAGILDKMTGQSLFLHSCFRSTVLISDPPHLSIPCGRELLEQLEVRLRCPSLHQAEKISPLHCCAGTYNIQNFRRSSMWIQVDVCWSQYCMYVSRQLMQHGLECAAA